jgi:hypothetical protein
MSQEQPIRNRPPTSDSGPYVTLRTLQLSGEAQLPSHPYVCVSRSRKAGLCRGIDKKS